MENLTIDEVREQLNNLHSKILRSPFAQNVTHDEIAALVECKKMLGELKDVKEEVELYRNLDKTNFSDGYNRAVDEFAERLKELCGWEEDGFQYPYLLHESRIDEIAEHMKEGAV